MRVVRNLTLGALLLVASSLNVALVRATTDDDMAAPALDLTKLGPDGPFDHDALNSTVRGAKGKGGPEGGFSVRGVGGRLRLCPTGDCKESIVDIAMNHLHEVDAAGTVTTNRIKNFGGLTFNWTAPVTTLSTEGVNITTSLFNASLAIDGIATPVSYKAEVSFYAGNGTAKNGEQTIDVPAGGLKFAVWISDWPFLNDANKLHLGLRVVSQNKNGDKKPKGDKSSGQGRDKKVDRVALLDTTYLDSPVVAQIDGTMTTISSNVSVDNSSNFVVIDYAFPKFKTLYYDPVASSSDTVVEATSTPSPTTALRSLAAPRDGALVVALTAVVLATASLMQF